MARKKHTTDLTTQSLALAEYAAKALVVAELLCVKQKVVDGFSLDEGERAFAAELPGLSTSLKKKLAKKDGTLTVLARRAPRTHPNGDGMDQRPPPPV